MLIRLIQPFIRSICARRRQLSTHGLAMTPVVLYGSQMDREAFRAAVSHYSPDNRMKYRDLVLDFAPDFGADTRTDEMGNQCVPVVDQSQASRLSSFDSQLFFERLKTRHLGRIVLHSQQMNSTFEHLNSCDQVGWHGLTVICDEQRNGRGRAGNQWTSPTGCVMFSMRFDTKVKRAALLQHLVSMAAVHAIKSLGPTYQCLGVGLKWPNDIYYNRKQKLGGVLVHSSFFRDRLTCHIGMGINLDNASPTICLNQVIAEHKAEPVSREVLLAETFNCLEAFSELLERPTGTKLLLDLYYQYWIHDGQQIRLKQNDLEDDEATVIGLDDDGFLLVRLHSNNQVVSLHPDGNSFDLMSGLVRPKAKSIITG